jgi:Fe-S cluster biosynthesis and repair protein YggX
MTAAQIREIITANVDSAAPRSRDGESVLRRGYMSRTVICSKYKKELPGLEKPPFGGEMGKVIFEKVSAQAWNEWNKDVQIKVLNEYRLNMADPRDYQVLVDQMKRFLGLEEGAVAEVENSERGRRQ